MDPWLPLIEVDALPTARGRRVCKGGLDLAVFKVGEAVFAIGDSCPHAGASLSNGMLQGTRVTCQAHGLKFELHPGRSAGPVTLQVKKYPVCTVDGMVMLDLGARASDPVIPNTATTRPP